MRRKKYILAIILSLILLPMLHFGQGILIQPGAKMTVQNGAKLTTTGTAGITVKSDATGTGSFLDQNTGSGNVIFAGTQTVERYLTQDKWHYIGIPMASITSNVFLNDYISYFKEPSGVWSKCIIPTDTVLQTKLLGYKVWSPLATSGATKTFTGTLNTGTISLSVTRTGDSNEPGWNLIGNPYPSAINIGCQNTEVSGWTMTNVSRVFYFWDQSNSRYAYYSWAGSGTGTNGGTQYIPAMQGCFVQVSSGQTSGTVGLTNETRVHSSQTFWKHSQEIPANRIRLKVEGNGNSDEIVITFNNNTTPQCDPDYDAYKFFGGADAPQLYSLTPDSARLVINYLPMISKETVIPLGIKTETGGTYSLRASEFNSFTPGVSISLEDLKEQKSQDLQSNPEYQFVSQPDNEPIRFHLHFTNLPFSVEEVGDDKSFTVYPSGSQIVVITNIQGVEQANVIIYDMVGRSVFQSELSQNSINRLTTNLQSGYYVIRIQTGMKCYVKKVFISY